MSNCLNVPIGITFKFHYSGNELFITNLKTNNLRKCHIIEINANPRLYNMNTENQGIE